MRRRALLACGAALAAAAARAQAPGRTYRLAHLALTAQLERTLVELLLPELEPYGFVVGRNLAVESRAGPPDALPALARELLAGRPDVVVTLGFFATRAMSEATGGVPIVVSAPDPVASGFAASLARPGGNVTGFTNMTVELQIKCLEQLTDAVPAARRIGLLMSAPSPQALAIERALRETASRAGIELATVYARGAPEYPAAFAALRAAGGAALMIASDLQFITDSPMLAAQALDARLPTSCEVAEMARDGCMLSYGQNRRVMRRRLADQIARIFRGAAPAEIPIEQPTVFEFIVNLHSARAIGLAIPAILLGRADEVIE
jgi:putative ABC transport system substrate-binding protein